MKIRKPTYMDLFHCIGGNCEDTCCAGWYIEIDEATLKKYKKVKAPKMKVRLQKELVEKKNAISPEHVAKIKLKNNRCAFLNKEGWCDIYTELGEGYLSNTCTLYPRTIHQVNGMLEYSLVPSCPEACRLILGQEAGIQIKEVEELVDKVRISATIEVNNKPSKWQDYYLELRKIIITILQNRDFSLEERMNQLAIFTESLEESIRRNEIGKMKNYLANWTQPMQNTSIQTTSKEGNEISLLSAKLAIYLKVMQEEKKFSSIRYTECLEDALLGLGCKDNPTLANVVAQYKAVSKEYYEPFLKEKEWMLENYFVNYVLERCMPLDGDTPRESFKRLELYYQLIRLHLVGMGKANKGITEEVIVKLIQSFTKVFDHSDVLIPKITEYLSYNRD